MLKSFIEKLTAMSQEELDTWLLEGASSCAKNSLAPSKAFKHASLSFGYIWSGTAELHQELTELFKNLDAPTQKKFCQSLANAIENFPIAPEYQKFANDLIITGIETDPDGIAEAATGRFERAPDGQKEKLGSLLVFLLPVVTNAEKTLKLAKLLLENEEISSSAPAQILVALCKRDPDKAAEYAKKLKPKLQIQMQTLNPQSAPLGYARFKNDLSNSVPFVSVVYNILDIP